MAEILLFVTPQEITEGTILDGNTDTDKYTFCIEDVQDDKIQTLLGTELYDKIIADIEADTLVGDYLELYKKFVQPITKFESVAEYISISPYEVRNAGTIKLTPSGSEVVDSKEVDKLSLKYSAKAQNYIGKFEKWIGLHSIPEYKTSQDEVDASKNISLNPTWYFRE